MANWNKPDLTTTKANWPAETRALATNAAKMDYSGDTNIPTGAVRYVPATNEFEVYNGSTWDTQQIGSAPITSALSNITNGSLAITQLPIVGSTNIASRVLPKALKITHLSFVLLSTGALTGGTLTVTLYKNGATTGKTLVKSTTGTSAYGSITPESFAAGDTISLAVTQSSCTFNGGSSTIITDAWGYFTD